MMEVICYAVKLCCPWRDDSRLVNVEWSNLWAIFCLATFCLQLFCVINNLKLYIFFCKTSLILISYYPIICDTLSIIDC